MQIVFKRLNANVGHLILYLMLFDTSAISLNQNIQL